MTQQFVWHRSSTGAYYNLTEEGSEVVLIFKQRPDFGPGEPNPVEWVVSLVPKSHFLEGDDDGRIEYCADTLRSAKIWAEHEYMGV